FEGVMRLPTVKYLAGEKTFTTIYKENNCTFTFDINKTYFSPRLSNERKMIAEEVGKETKNNFKILIAFAGVAPYPIVLAKKLKQLKKKNIKIISSEINPDACTYAKENIKKNKVENMIEVKCENSKEIPKNTKEKYDIIMMQRPNLKDTFLKEMLKVSKKGTIIYYHGFGTHEKVEYEIKKHTKNKIKNLTMRKAGDIKAYEYRWQAKMVVK
ncbi:MAG: tRNA (guanine37-N1)-methyltransferase, partial [Patescibacteria group bacterium]